jgi:hypothetical protein
VAAAISMVLPLSARPLETSLIRWPFMADLTVLPVKFSNFY